MDRKDYPNAAFGYVDEAHDVKFLLHHDPECVKSGNEHNTVDPALLMLALELFDIVPFTNEANKKEVKRHLQSHANVVLWKSEDVNSLPIALNEKLRDIAFFKANMDGVNEAPPVTTEARGIAYVMYDKRTKEMSWFITFEGLSSAQSASHFHMGRGGKLGDVVLPISNGSPSEGSMVLSDELEKVLFEGKMYVNIHSSNYPLGEIRGQVIPAAV
ncbi:MAG: CHRD domain-containing protein, partial [Candidatus Kariarchaeaceae archaeon]